MHWESALKGWFWKLIKRSILLAYLRYIVECEPLCIDS